MCYDVQSKLETLLKRAIRYHDLEGIEKLKKELKPYLTNYYHASGFAHPSMLIYCNKQEGIPTPAIWGLVPHWVKDQKQKLQLWNSTINARGETIFNKPSFRDAAKNKRCVLYPDGFYEHHYHKGKGYPFSMKKKNKEPMVVAGLWSEWADRETGEIIRTFTIVTTKANPFMAKIHNNPKLKEARMPLILTENEEDIWLNNELKGNNPEITKLIRPYTEHDLSCHTVKKIRGKEALGNVPESSEKFAYRELAEI